MRPASVSRPGGRWRRWLESVPGGTREGLGSPRHCVTTSPALRVMAGQGAAVLFLVFLQVLREWPFSLYICDICISCPILISGLLKIFFPE